MPGLNFCYYLSRKFLRDRDRDMLFLRRYIHHTSREYHNNNGIVNLPKYIKKYLTMEAHAVINEFSNSSNFERNRPDAEHGRSWPTEILCVARVFGSGYYFAQISMRSLPWHARFPTLDSTMHSREYRNNKS